MIVRIIDCSGAGRADAEKEVIQCALKECVVTVYIVAHAAITQKIKNAHSGKKTEVVGRPSAKEDDLSRSLKELGKELESDE